jgi:predicted nucleotidyltransferase
MGGSGSGTSGGYRRLPRDIENLVAEARSRETERLNTQVSEYLAEVLSTFRGREADLTNRRLDSLAPVLGNVVEVDKVLLEGSVAKHTDVDGISDIDALVVLNRADLVGKPPAEVRAAFYTELDAKLDRSEVASVQVGKMAVTVVYRDGMEIQLLPAMQSGKRVIIGGPGGDDWMEIAPRRFQAALTDANKKLGNALVPAIKLLKSINADLPPQKQLRSYHIEAMAVDAARNYEGPLVPREILIHLCKHASARVLRPILDLTGQSRRADEYMGEAHSVQRRNAAQALAGIGRRLDAASSLDEWKAIFGQ